MIKVNLVDNKHLQLQLLFIQFLSAALVDSAANEFEEINENTNQTTTTTSRNQIAGKDYNKLQQASNYRFDIVSLE